MPLRRWFQIHLSTALILMLAASLLLWANVTPDIEYSGSLPWEVCYGWPYIFCGEPGHVVANVEHFFSYKSIILNFACALSILLLVAIASEWILRRNIRKANAGCQPSRR